MDRHLNDIELNEALAGNVPPEIASHLAACTICRSSRDEMEYLLQGVSSEAEALANKPEGFWQVQRQQIQAQVFQKRSFFAPRYAWAAIAAVLIVGLALLFRPAAPVKPQPVQITAENDQQLMLDVEQTLNSDVAPPLEPAQALVQAMTSSRSHGSSGTKETRNEN